MSHHPHLPPPVPAAHYTQDGKPSGPGFGAPKSGSYVPPSMRGGGGRGGEGESMQMRKRDDNSVRVTNLSEDVTETDLQVRRGHGGGVLGAGGWGGWVGRWVGVSLGRVCGCSEVLGGGEVGGWDVVWCVCGGGAKWAGLSPIDGGSTGDMCAGVRMCVRVGMGGGCGTSEQAMCGGDDGQRLGVQG